MDLTSTALQGLQQANSQLNSAANKIATYGANSPAGASLDTVDLSSAVVALLSAKNQFSASAATLKVGDEVQQNLLDVTA